MKIAFFSAKGYDRASFLAANEKFGHDLVFLEAHLNGQTAFLASGAGAICAFVNDHLDASVLDCLAKAGVRLIALRSAGFNHVDLRRATSSDWLWHACRHIPLMRSPSMRSR